MKNLLVLASLLFAFQVLADSSKEISGTVSLAKGLDPKSASNGTLFIFAKSAGAPAGSGMPVAVLKIPSPHFPYSFTISGKNAMVPGTPFDGPFAIYARYSPSGDAMDKSGPQGTDEKHPSVGVGQKDLHIELKAPKIGQ
jgi:hypothetical protein